MYADDVKLVKKRPMEEYKNHYFEKALAKWRRDIDEHISKMPPTEKIPQVKLPASSEALPDPWVRKLTKFREPTKGRGVRTSYYMLQEYEEWRDQCNPLWQVCLLTQF